MLWHVILGIVLWIAGISADIGYLTAYPHLHVFPFILFSVIALAGFFLAVVVTLRDLKRK